LGNRISFDFYQNTTKITLDAKFDPSYPLVVQFGNQTKPLLVNEPVKIPRMKAQIKTKAQSVKIQK